jgi:hypothetical protein
MRYLTPPRRSVFLSLAFLASLVCFRHRPGSDDAVRYGGHPRIIVTITITIMAPIWALMHPSLTHPPPPRDRRNEMESDGKAKGMRNECLWCGDDDDDEGARGEAKGLGAVTF